MSPQEAPQAPTVRSPKRLSLVQTYSSRNGTLLQDARLINAFAEKDKLTGDWQVEKRPCLLGYAFSSTETIGLGIIGANLNGPEIDTFAIETPGYCFDIEGGDAIQLTDTTVDDSYPYAMYRYEAGEINTVVFQNETKAYYLIDTEPGVPPWQDFSLSPVTGFPAGPYAFGWAYLDGTLYIMDSAGSVWGSDIQDITTWNALNVIQANVTPDRGIALSSHLTYVLAFKQYSTNIFYDAGNSPGSPLAPVPDALIPYGCMEGTTVKEIDGNTFWLCMGSNQVPQVGRLSNLSFTIASTPAVDRLLFEYSAAHVPGLGENAWRASTLKMSGHRFYLLSTVGGRFTLAYDLDFDQWHIWQDAQGNPFPTVSDQASNITSTTILLAQQINAYNGLYYRILPDYDQPTDAISSSGGGAFTYAVPTVDIYTPSFDGGTRRRKQLNFMFFNADKDPGSTLKSRWNEDDYQSDQWSNFRSIDLSSRTPTLASNGTFRRRAYHFRHQCPTPFRLSSVDLQLDLGDL